MLTLSAENKKFSLEILDYEFPDLADLGGPVPPEVLEEMGMEHDFDSNWLMIKLHGENEGMVWEVEDPSLLTWEVETLMEWFRNLAENEEREDISPMLSFLEPCFTIYQREEGDIIYLRFALTMELAPPGHKPGMEYYIDFEINREKAAELSDYLALALARFPIR